MYDFSFVKISYRFASLATRTFVSVGIPVHLYSALVPTPYIPFGVCQLKTKAGIMITASHNPKEDNGYKVYWENGAQVCSLLFLQSLFSF